MADLQIHGFRGIGELAIPRLGRVTLLAGRNGVGKTTVLDAIRLYAAMGHRLALAQLIERREGLPPTVHDRGGARAPLDFGTLFFDDRHGFPPAAKCESVGPESLTTEDAARLWDNIALTEQEDLAVSALNLVFGDEVKRVAMLGGGRGSEDGRRIAVRLKGRERPVSLQSLGDGAVRLFGIALALANAGEGFLVIDEAENGIHHSVQPAMWEMVLRTAHRDGVQVLATTHSWDCVRGFAKAASAAEDLDGVLVRLEGANDRIRAVEYGAADLAAAAEQGIEVR